MIIHTLSSSILLRELMLSTSTYHKKLASINLAFLIIIMALSATGCNTLKALEPTAILISDIAKAL